MIKRGFASRKAQLKLSFGMIFSIILIILFISVAVYAIIKFIGIGESAQIQKFKNSLQNDIDKVWKASQSLQEEEYFLPEKIEYICFADFNNSQTSSISLNELEKAYYGSENLFFYPVEKSGYDSVKVEHINLNEITENENPYCIKNSEGKIKLTLEKDFDEILVKVSRN